MIKRITIVAKEGISQYTAGDMLEGIEIHKIKEGFLSFQGNPYAHYIGYSSGGKRLFSVNCIIPCDIIYL